MNLDSEVIPITMICILGIGFNGALLLLLREAIRQYRKDKS